MSKTYIDANAIIYYLTGKPENLAKQAACMVEGEVTVVVEVLNEVIYVLECAKSTDDEGRETKSYPTENLMDLLLELDGEVYYEPRDIILYALRMHREHPNLDMVDCELLARNVLHNDAVCTFDKRLKKRLLKPGGAGFQGSE